jgi:predicted NAD/FAD-dependent oxidoreductase
LPQLAVLKDDLTTADMKISNNLYCCGDHLMNGSINAAMKSGRLLADLIARGKDKKNSSQTHKIV